jgi:hypothetical protein
MNAAQRAGGRAKSFRFSPPDIQCGSVIRRWSHPWLRR